MGTICEQCASWGQSRIDLYTLKPSRSLLIVKLLTILFATLLKHP